MNKMQSRLEKLEESIFTNYATKTIRSYNFYQRACQSLVAGVSGSVRYFAPYPLYFSNGSGSQVVDLDNNTYTDCVLGNGSLLLGHTPSAVMTSMQEHLKLGTMMMNPELVTEVAEQLVKSVSSAERVRFMNSGTEAVMSAMRIARAATGKDKIIKLTGAYHGQADQVLTGLDPHRRTAGAGIPQSAHQATLVAELGDDHEIDRLLGMGNVAAILLDPSMHHAGMWAGGHEVYKSLRERSHAAEALLIFDEVISGFRLNLGGAQEYFGVTPDLTTFAKALAAGERLGAVVGAESIMCVTDPSLERPQGPFAFQSGTNNDATCGLAAAQGALQQYAEFQNTGGYDRLSALAVRLGSGIQSAFATKGLDIHVNQLGPMVKLFFVAAPQSFADCAGVNIKARTLFHLALVSEGVLTIPGSNDFFLSFAHSENDVDAVIAAAQRVLERYDFASAIIA